MPPLGIYAASNLNPGAGDVIGETTHQAALENLEQLLEEAGGELVSIEDRLDHTGRLHARAIGPAGALHAIEMPGLPLAEVRFTREPGQNIWDYPRIFVDGDSWVWFYAVETIKAGD